MLPERCRTTTLIVALLAVFLAWARSVVAQGSEGWRDPSPHAIRFVPVEHDVTLEVLDWGGTGRDVILLAALGNSAHVFDEFAPKLSGAYHVWGITRRGFGASSSAKSGYSADRLGDDVIAVIDALNLRQPVLAGNSIAGEELSSVGTRYPNRASALVYMEAAYAYAFYDDTRGDFLIDTLDLQRKLGLLLPGKQAGGDLKKLVQELLDRDLPGFQKTLQRTNTILNSGPAQTMPQPLSNDRDSSAPPEAESRQQFVATSRGGVGEPRSTMAATDAVLAGERRFTTNIQVPVLAIFANGGPQADFVERAVHSATVVRIPNAQHAIFLSNQRAVLDAIRSFLMKLQ
jgi:non-heme chloroperoxidase